MRRLFSCVVLALLSASVAGAQPLTTLAGRGGTGDCPTFDPPPGGGGFFFDPVSAPAGVAVDPSGRLFVAMASNCVVRLDADGLLRIGFPDNGPFRIGTGSSGFADGDAAAARVSNPQKLALDRAGNLYIADSSNQRIRKVDTAQWTISTVAGGGSLRPIDGIPATSASFLFPTGVAVDGAGNVYVSDTNAQKVFKVDTNGILTKVAGSGGSTYNGENIPAISAAMIPMGIDVDGAGNLFIADWSNSIIRKVTPDGNITTVAGTPFNSTALGDGGPAAFSASLAKPRGVAVDEIGNIFIADTEHHRIRRVDAAGIITTVAGNGAAGNLANQLNLPWAVAVDNLGNVFIADTGNNQLRGVIATQRSYQLTLQSAGTGSGLVLGGGSYIVGQTAAVSATPNAGSRFTGWSGANAAACATGTVVMNADKACTATFDAVPDTTAPTLFGVPASFTVTATGATGAVVTFALPFATDPDDPAGPVTCTPASGSTFAVGTTTVTCTSTDTHGNTGFASFTVTVDALPSVVSVNVDETVHVTDAPAVMTSVQMSIVEAVQVADAVTLAAIDTTPPVLMLPTTITVGATSSTGAVVTFITAAIDAVNGPTAVSCVPPSGSTFRIGTTTVTCSATDQSGNTATGTFVVVVLTPAQMVARLVANVTAAAFQQGVQLLLQVIASVSRSNTAAACGQLSAFISQVQAQAGKSLTHTQANELLTDATAIKAVLRCR